MPGYQSLPGLPKDGEVGEVIVYDVVTRQLVLPAGTVLRVPMDHEWVITAITAIPHPRYSPPGTPRDQYEFGDVILRVKDSHYFQGNALSMMDRYWGRYNLNPELSEVITKIEDAQHAVQSAPTIPDLALAVELTERAVLNYQNAVSPRFETPVIAKSGDEVAVEQTACKGHKEATYTSLDVELLVVVKRPCRGRGPEDAR